MRGPALLRHPGRLLLRLVDFDRNTTRFGIRVPGVPEPHTPRRRSAFSPRWAAAACIVAACALSPSHAHATVRPPADSLRVRFDWIDQGGSPWLARVRALRYTTSGSAPGTTVFTALALRLADSLAVAGADSALVVLPGTRIPAPGYPVLLPDAPTATAFRNQAGAPAGGFWLGARATARTAIVLPNEPVDILWFVRVIPDSTGTAAPIALRGATFGSATANGAGAPTGNVAFKTVSKLGVSSPRGGGGPHAIDP